MASFTKKYTRAFHPEQSLLLSWDSGYKNVTVYDGDRIVKSWDQAGQFSKGVSFQDETLGKVRIKFTDTRPLQLELRVNGKKYKPTKKGKQEIDLSGTISVYWGMMAFTAILLIFTLLFSSMNGILVGNFEGLGILSGITGVYLFSALAMSFKKHWAFFIGFGYMVLSTGWYTINILELTPSLSPYLYLFIRYILLIYLGLNIRKVLFAMRLQESEKTENPLDQ